MSSSPPNAGPFEALRHIFRPLVRLMLAHGITYPQLIEMLKSLFVELAEQEFALDKKAQTDSRISLLTGVHRKDVKKLRDSEKIEKSPKSTPLGSRIVATWVSQGRYLDANGDPRPLSRFPSSPDVPSFEELAYEVSKDVRPRTALDEMQQQGIIRMREDGMLELVMQAYVPSRDQEAKLFYLANNLHDHASASVSNVMGNRPLWLERSVHYDDIAPEHVSELHRQAETIGMKVLHKINQSAVDFEQSPETNSSQGHKKRFTFGIYFYAEDINATLDSNLKEGTE